MLGVDEGGSASALLGLGDDVESNRGLAGGFWAIDLGDTTSGEAPDPKRQIERYGGGRDTTDSQVMRDAEFHD